VAFVGAVGADSGDDEAVTGDAEAVFAGDCIADSAEVGALEFDELIADRAVQVVVLRIAVVVLVDGPSAKVHAAK